MSEWKDISTAPKDGTPILLLSSYYNPKTTPHSWTDWMRAHHTYGSVPHWRPLLDPPKPVAVDLILQREDGT